MKTVNHINMTFSDVGAVGVLVGFLWDLEGLVLPGFQLSAVNSPPAVFVVDASFSFQTFCTSIASALRTALPKLRAK